MSRLVLCRACKRHVRRSEPTCPFCAAAIEAAPVARVSLGPAVTRAALLVSSAAAVGAGISGCADDDRNTQLAIDSERTAQTADDEAAAETEPAARMLAPAYGVAIDDDGRPVPGRPRPIDAGATVPTTPSDAARADAGAADAAANPDFDLPRRPRPPIGRRDGGGLAQPAYGVAINAVIDAEE